MSLHVHSCSSSHADHLTQEIKHSQNLHQHLIVIREAEAGQLQSWATDYWIGTPQLAKLQLVLFLAHLPAHAGFLRIIHLA